MRQITFRGKRIDNGEWVEGYLNGWITDNKQVRAIITPEEVFIVTPETVGQYVCTINSGEIYEGDINEEGGVCKYFDSEFKWSYGKNLPTRRIQRNDVAMGNIHDNPELLNKINN